MSRMGACHAQSLPNAPSTLMGLSLVASLDLESDPQKQTQVPLPATIAVPSAASKEPVPILPCDNVRQQEMRSIPWWLRSPSEDARCHRENPLQEIVSEKNTPALTPELKGYLAIRNLTDPFNLMTIVGYSGIQIAVNSHTAYGPGLKGWGRLVGYSTLEDAQDEFFGTFAIPSLVHEDPRYHRMPDAPVRKRIFHALSHLVVSQHDDGRPMINYATLLTYPISAELSNMYVPGLAVNAPSTAKRVLAGYATEPIGPLIAEFLPDVAKHVHIHVVFVQEILQKIAVNQQNVAP
jgi:hypothetical protein